MTKKKYYRHIYIILGATLLFSGCGDPTGKTQLRKGMEKLEQKQYHAAVKFLEKAVEKQPSSANGWYHLGVACYYLQKLDQAAMAFERAADLAPEDSTPLEFAAVVYLQLQRWNDARTAIEQAQERNPKAPHLLTRMSLIELKAGENQKAFKLMRKAINDFPDYPPAWYNLAVFYKEHLNDSASARTHFGKFLELDADNPRADKARKVLLETKEKEIKEKEIKKKATVSKTLTNPTPVQSPTAKPSATINEESAQTKPLPMPVPITATTNETFEKAFNDAKSRIKNGAYDEALVLLKQAVQANPQSADALWELACLYDKHLNMQESAARSYTKFKEKFPDDPRISQIPNQMVSKSSSPPPKPVSVPPPPQEILQTVDKIEATELFQRAVDYHEKKEWAKAIELYDEVLRLNPQNANALYNKGLIYKTTNNNENAKKAFMQSLAINPNMYKARYMLAIIFMDESNHEKAVEELNSALRIKPDYADAHYALGLTYWKLLKYDTAVTHFQRYLQIDPKGRYAQSAKNYIERKQRQ